MPPLRVLKPDDYNFQRYCTSLEQYGIRDCADVLVKTDLSDVSRMTDVPFEVLKELRDTINKGFGSKVGTMAKRIDEVRGNLRLCPTGCHALDRFLCGGIRGGDITQITGAEGCGKTQFCYSIAADEMIRGNRVVFIDTESTFCAERVTTILRNKSGRCADLKPLMELMLVIQVHKLHDLFDLIYRLIEETKTKAGHYSLLILDSVPSIVTPHLNQMEDEQEQFSIFKEMIRALNIMRHTNPSLVILVTNNKLKWFKRMWQNACAVTLLLQKKPVVTSAPSPHPAEAGQDQGGRNKAEELTIVRRLEIIHSNALTVNSDPRFEVVITDSGFTDYCPDAVAGAAGHSQKTGE